MATVARYTWHFIVQDNRGFRANVRMVGFDADISTDTTTFMGAFTAAGAMGTALAAATNAKVVESGFDLAFDIAQEPSSETGTYQLVSQGAHNIFGSGGVQKEFMTIPAPKDAIFLTTSQDKLIVVDPASSLIAAIQSAGANLPTSDGGHWGAQFFGGQLRAQKPRRRRVLQGA